MFEQLKSIKQDWENIALSRLPQFSSRPKSLQSESVLTFHKSVAGIKL